MTGLSLLASMSSVIDLITEITEDCREFEYSLLGRNYGLLIRIYLEFLKNFKWNMLLLIYCLYTKKNNFA